MNNSICNITSKTLSLFPEIKKMLSSENSISIEEKSGIGNFVTNTDKQLDEFIKINLLKLYPKQQL